MASTRPSPRKVHDAPDLLAVPLLVANELFNGIRLAVANLGGGAGMVEGSGVVH